MHCIVYGMSITASRRFHRSRQRNVNSLNKPNSRFTDGPSVSIHEISRYDANSLATENRDDRCDVCDIGITIKWGGLVQNINAYYYIEEWIFKSVKYIFLRLRLILISVKEVHKSDLETNCLLCIYLWVNDYENDNYIRHNNSNIKLLHFVEECNIALFHEKNW